MYKDIFKKIDELFPEYVKVWEDICNIESPTNYKEGVDAVCEYFVKMSEKLGWDVEILHQEVAGNAACITINPEVDAPQFCLSGHMDTVHPVGSFGYPPVRIEGDLMHGPGTVDCKGGCVSSFLAMDALFKCGYKNRPVKLILQSDEETGSKTSGKKTVEFMCEKAKGAVAFINGESCDVKKKWTVALSRKGILRYRFNITGKAVHSASCYDGANAIAEAAHKILELERMKDKDGLTCNCGVIEGGTVANTVAEKCSFLADIRFATMAQMQEAEREVMRIANICYVEGCSCNVEKVSDRPPMEKSEKNVALLEKINSIMAECGYEPIKSEMRNGGSDAAYITAIGVPCIDNLGILGNSIHSINECAVISSLAEAAKIMAATIAAS